MPEEVKRAKVPEEDVK